MTRNMKKLMRLQVSTFADNGRVFFRYAYLGPMTAPSMILTACPPQYVCTPILCTCQYLSITQGGHNIPDACSNNSIQNWPKASKHSP